ncbi:MAG: hypothetical protein ABIA77_02005 [Candidatus Omnitrophota bacterium]
MIYFDRDKYHGGTEYKLLITPLVRKIIRAVAALAILLLIYCLL